MKKILSAAACCMILLLSMSGCIKNPKDESSVISSEAETSVSESKSEKSSSSAASSKAPASSEVSSEAESSASETSSQPPDPVKSGSVFIEEATEELKDKYSSLQEYVIDENGTEMLITTDTFVEDFSLFTVNFSESAESVSFYKGNILETQEKLSAEQPLLVKMTAAETFPRYGISYIGENGDERCFGICSDSSGEVGKPPYFLMEIDNEPPDSAENTAFALM